VQTGDATTDGLGRPVSAGAPEVVLGRYRLEHRLGAGGFGVVWLAHDEHLDRAVAVKRIGVHDAAVAARAEREARAAARLAHPGIVALYEAGRDDEAVYLVSELVRGRTLRDLLDDGAVSDRDVLEIGVALCDALAHAHGRGVVHRDVKPGNVLVPDRRRDGAGVAKLTDFGVAALGGEDALTRTGDVVGTLAYMAPEQAEGRAAGAEVDLYALALVLYEALAGVNPVRGRGAASTARRLGARLPPLGRLRRDLPLALCAALDRGVRPRAEERGTVADLRAALAGALPEAADEAGTIVGGPLEPLAPPAARPRTGGRSRLLAALGAGALAAAALAWPAAPSPPLPPAAGGLAVSAAVLAVPRLGWLVAALALATWTVAAGRPGAAVMVGAVVLPTALLLRRSGALWSAPALAPVLGLAGVAGAWPALAGQAAAAWRRAALGVLGGWWVALAAAPAADWRDGAGRALREVVAPAADSEALALAGVWSAAALVLPLLVRGRALPADLAMATAWAAALGAATQALAPGAPGLVTGTVAAGGAALAAGAWRGEASTRPDS
jgi:eukaryotic-like serine/threonine-protein kinase